MTVNSMIYKQEKIKCPNFSPDVLIRKNKNLIPVCKSKSHNIYIKPDYIKKINYLIKLNGSNIRTMIFDWIDYRDFAFVFLREFGLELCISLEKIILNNKKSIRVSIEFQGRDYKGIYEFLYDKFLSDPKNKFEIGINSDYINNISFSRLISIKGSIGGEVIKCIHDFFGDDGFDGERFSELKVFAI